MVLALSFLPFIIVEHACDCEELCDMQDVRKDGDYYVYTDQRFIRIYCEFNSSKFGNLTDNGIGYNWLVEKSSLLISIQRILLNWSSFFLKDIDNGLIKVY